MLTIALIVAAATVISGIVGFLTAKKIDSAKYQIYIEQSKSKAKAIEHEAELKLEAVKAKEGNLELEFRKKSEMEAARLRSEYDSKVMSLAKKEEMFAEKTKNELKNIESKKNRAEELKKTSEVTMSELSNLKKIYEAKLDDVIAIAEKGAGLTMGEARELLLEKTKEKCREDISHVVRKYEAEAKAEARKRANYVIAQATTRYAESSPQRG